MVTVLPDVTGSPKESVGTLSAAKTASGASASMSTKNRETRRMSVEIFMIFLDGRIVSHFFRSGSMRRRPPSEQVIDEIEDIGGTDAAVTVDIGGANRARAPGEQIVDPGEE